MIVVNRRTKPYKAGGAAAAAVCLCLALASCSAPPPSPASSRGTGSAPAATEGLGNPAASAAGSASQESGETNAVPPATEAQPNPSAGPAAGSVSRPAGATGATAAKSTGKTPPNSSKSPSPSQGNQTQTQKTEKTPGSTAAGEPTVSYDTDYFTYRSGLTNTYAKLTKEKKLTVAYMGGSVTWGVGATNLDRSYRAKTTQWLRDTFPQASITEINASVPSACSAFGAYCVDQDVIAHKPDLVFVEYAINDSYASASYNSAEVSRQYETILRKIFTALPQCEVVALYTTDANKSMTPALYSQAQIQEDVAAYYGVPSINIGWQLRMERGLRQPRSGGQLTSKWLTYFTDIVHLTDGGYAEYASIITRCLHTAFDAAEKAKKPAAANRSLPQPKNQQLLMQSTCLKTAKVDLSGSRNWKKSESVFSSYQQYVGYIYTDSADNELVFTFTGTSVAIFGSESKKFKYSVDGGDWKTRTYASHPTPLAKGLSKGQHTVRLQAVEPSGQFAIAAVLTS